MLQQVHLVRKYLVPVYKERHLSFKELKLAEKKTESLVPFLLSCSSRVLSGHIIRLTTVNNSSLNSAHLSASSSQRGGGGGGGDKTDAQPGCIFIHDFILYDHFCNF